MEEEQEGMASPVELARARVGLMVALNHLRASAAIAVGLLQDGVDAPPSEGGDEESALDIAVALDDFGGDVARVQRLVELWRSIHGGDPGPEAHPGTSEVAPAP